MVADCKVAQFEHLVTLQHPVSGEEVSFTLVTPSDRFLDVHNELARQRSERGLRRYELIEVLPLQAAF